MDVIVQYLTGPGTRPWLFFSLFERFVEFLGQGSETCGLRVSCGPPVNFIRPCHWSYYSYRKWPGSMAKNSLITMFVVTHLKAQDLLSQDVKVQNTSAER